MDYKLKKKTKCIALKKNGILKISMYLTFNDGGLFFNFYFSMTMTYLNPHISFYFHEKIRV